MQSQYAPPHAKVADVAQGGGIITVGMVEAMRRTRPWVLFIGVLLFLAAAFSVMGGLAAVAGMVLMANARDNLPGVVVAAMGIFYLVASVIYVFLGVHLLKYSSAIGRLVASGHGQDMEDALQSQHRFWRLCGALALVGLVVALVGIVAAITIPALVALPR
jgi:predicted membrane channel-forming protein YqfA (hemolysin III family)